MGCVEVVGSNIFNNLILVRYSVFQLAAILWGKPRMVSDAAGRYNIIIHIPFFISWAVASKPKSF
jgi:hypothetical protein